MDKNKITPVKVRDLPAFIAACEPIAQALMSGNIQAALVQHSESLIQATAIGAGVERSWLDDQPLDTLVDLAAQVVEANLDFFVRVLLPKVQAVTERLTDLTTSIGGTSGSQP